MKSRNTLIAASFAAFAALSGNAAFAQEATYEMPIPAVSNITRAQVQAELVQARRDGSMRVWSTSYNHMAAAKSLRTRDDVVAEVIAEHRNANALVLNGEDSGSFAFARQLRVTPAATTIAAAR